MIYLKSVPLHPTSAPTTTEIPPIIVYPENSAEQLRQSELEKQPIPGERTEKGSGKTDLKFALKTTDNSVIKSKHGSLTEHKDHYDRKRDVYVDQLGQSEESDSGYDIEDKYDRNSDGPNNDNQVGEQKKMDYYYAGDEAIDFEDATNSVGDENIEDRTKRIERFHQTDLRKDGDKKRVSPESYRTKLNRISVGNEIRRNYGVTNSSVKDVGPVMIGDVTGDSTDRMVPEGRALFKSEEERRKTQALKMTEERYFVNADHNEDVGSSIIQGESKTCS